MRLKKSLAMGVIAAAISLGSSTAYALPAHAPGHATTTSAKAGAWASPQNGEVSRNADVLVPQVCRYACF